MLTYEQLAELERSLRSQRVLTVYVNGESHDVAKRDAWRREVELGLVRARDGMEHPSHQERERFDRCAAVLNQWMASHAGAIRAAGWVGFVADGKFAHEGVLPVEVPTSVRWGEGIVVAPYLRSLKHHRPVLAAIVDMRTARLYRYHGGALTTLETLEAHAHVEVERSPTGPPMQGFHTGTRGNSASDEAQRQVEAGAARLRALLAEHLVPLAADGSWILIGGPSESAHAALERLPKTLAERAMISPALHVHASEHEIAVAAGEGAAIFRRELDRRAAAAMVGNAASGRRGAVTLADTLPATSEGRAQQLMLTLPFIEREPAAAEQLVRAAFDHHTDVEVASGEAAVLLDREAGGVAASLRYVVNGASSNGTATLDEPAPA